jgi:hypothetical protein
VKHNIVDDHLKLFILEDITAVLCDMVLDEGGTSTYRRTKGTKRDALAGRSAVAICKDKNPALYNKYKKYRNLFLKHKQIIMQRYGSRGLMHARSALT